MNPELEFADTPEPDNTPAPPSPPPAPEVTKADVEALRGELQGKLAEIDALKSKTAVVDKLQELFSGKVEDPKDAYVRKEIQRLVPELDDMRKIRELLPAILETLYASAEERVAERADTAKDLMRDLMGNAGLDPKDEDAVGYMEEALTREIRNNKELLGMWARGNVKSAVNKAFEKVQAKLIAPVRTRTKRDAVNTINQSPRPTPRGGAPTPAPSPGTKVDLKDTSRDGVRKVHDAAFDRLQELMDR